MIYFKNKLKKELEIWLEKGFINTNSYEKISNFYSLDDQNSSALIYFAYLCFGISLIVLIGANWQEIPRILRVIFLFGLTFFIQICGVLKLKKDPFMANMAIFLGNFCFFGSVMLISQMFHIGKYPSDGVLFVLIFTLPFVMILKHPILITQNLLFATIWFLMEKFQGNYEIFYLLFLALNLYAIYKNYCRDVFRIWLLFFGLFLICGFENLFDCLNIFAIFLIFLYFLSKIKQFEKISDIFYEFSLTFGLMFLICWLIGYDIYFYYEIKSINFICVFLVLLCFVAIFTKSWFSFWFIFWIIFIDFGQNLPFFNEILMVLNYVICLIFGIFLLNKNRKFGILLIFSTLIILYFKLVGDYILTSLLFLLFGVFMFFISRIKR